MNQEPYRAVSPGVELRILRRHESGGLTFLIHMSKGARAVHHDHPGGEETYMLTGSLRLVNRTDAAGAPVADATLSAGEYFFAPPGEQHEGVADDEATFLVVAPGGVVRSTPFA